MQEQLARSQPARIQVGKIAPRPAVLSCIGNLVADKDPVHVEPHTRGCERSHDKEQTELQGLRQGAGRFSPQTVRKQTASCYN